MNPILYTKTRAGYNLASGRAVVQVVERASHGTCDVTLNTHEPNGWKQWGTSTHDKASAYSAAKRLLQNNK